LEDLLETLERLPTRQLDPEWLASIPLPEKDRPVLAAAILGGCEALVTGDRTHFGALFGSAIEGVAIHSPASLAEWLL